MYLPKQGVWKAMEKIFFVAGMNTRINMPVYLHGDLHIISDCLSFFMRGSPYFRSYIIMAYNFDSGESIMLRIPKDARKGSHDLSCDMRIFEWGKENSLEFRLFCVFDKIQEVCFHHIGFVRLQVKYVDKDFENKS